LRVVGALNNFFGERPFQASPVSQPVAFIYPPPPCTYEVRHTLSQYALLLQTRTLFGIIKSHIFLWCLRWLAISTTITTAPYVADYSHQKTSSMCMTGSPSCNRQSQQHNLHKMRAVWAFDFDGVVCDSVGESSEAAWKVRQHTVSKPQLYLLCLLCNVRCAFAVGVVLRFAPRPPWLPRLALASKLRVCGVVLLIPPLQPSPPKQKRKQAHCTSYIHSAYLVADPAFDNTGALMLPFTISPSCRCKFAPVNQDSS